MLSDSVDRLCYTLDNMFLNIRKYSCFAVVRRIVFNGSSFRIVSTCKAREVSRVWVGMWRSGARFHQPGRGRLHWAQSHSAVLLHASVSWNVSVRNVNQMAGFDTTKPFKCKLMALMIWQTVGTSVERHFYTELLVCDIWGIFEILSSADRTMRCTCEHAHGVDIQVFAPPSSSSPGLFISTQVATSPLCACV